MTLKKQIQILIWLFSLGFLVIAVVVFKVKGSDNQVQWPVIGVFNAKQAKQTRPDVPILKNNQNSLVVPVGRTIFIEGRNITEDSVLMLNRRVMRDTEYEIVEDKGVYFKAPNEGFFKISVLNKYGSSNEIEVEVSNAININISHFLEVSNQYKDISAWIGNIKVPLNNSGQGIAPKGVLIGGAVVQVTGVSKINGMNALLAIGVVNKGQKTEGVSITPYTTAKYLIDIKLINLGERKVATNPTDAQVLVVGNLANLIEKMQTGNKPYDLNSPQIEAESTRSVRNIRKLRN